MENDEDAAENALYCKLDAYAFLNDMHQKYREEYSDIFYTNLTTIVSIILGDLLYQLHSIDSEMAIKTADIVKTSSLRIMRELLENNGRPSGLKNE